MPNGVTGLPVGRLSGDIGGVLKGKSKGLIEGLIERFGVLRLGMESGLSGGVLGLDGLPSK